MKPILNVSNLSKNFGKKQIIENISFQVNDNEIFGLIGSNGCGKTTTLKLLTGLIQADNGSITIFDHPIPKENLKVKQLIGVVPDSDQLIDDLTAFEFLDFVRSLRQLDSKSTYESIEEWMNIFHLWKHKDELIKSFSHGMKKKLQIISALLHHPKFLLFDEPTNGLDPDMILIVKDLLKEIKKKGTSILLTTHNLQFAETTCDRISIMKDGSLLTSGESVDVLFSRYESKSLEEVYIKVSGELYNEYTLSQTLEKWK
ncbi:ABC transporter ATP-binding protein [Bacillus carboniphilus]|uniref:ABC transporter ATP-binding protein n=1 Tax=Bacillus carboniphilus TaxID=86663 RepID=A0ABY9JW57_9BACI|nr:ABC transporter ATP-binding protein [Bacillus carboniphilus]WLR43034.1 ABC transporter ATP-binding protein [Bacillus carboniphilus]